MPGAVERCEAYWRLIEMVLEQTELRARREVCKFDFDSFATICERRQRDSAVRTEPLTEGHPQCPAMSVIDRQQVVVTDTSVSNPSHMIDVLRTSCSGRLKSEHKYLRVQRRR